MPCSTTSSPSSARRVGPPLRSDDFTHESPWLNLYLYPDEIDYRRARQLGPHWQNLQASVRNSGPVRDVPEAMVDGEGPLIYLSLGSLGAADVALMRKLVAELADQPYRVIISQGPQAKKIELPTNMAGAELLPPNLDPAEGRPGDHPPSTVRPD